MSPTSNEMTTIDLIASVDRGTLGLNVTIGITIAIIIIGATVSATIIVIVIVVRSRRRSANPCSTSDGKTNGTQVAVGNGVGELRK